MALNAEKLGRKQVDPTANGKGRAGVLPHIPDVETALSTLDDEVFKQIEHEYYHGREKGQTTHNKYLDPFYKWMPGYTSVITGWPGHGKSRMFFELLLLRAVFGGKKSAIWPSENLPPKTFYQDLIHTLTGRPADKSQANHLSPAEMKRATEFLREHIILLNPPSGMPYSPAHMLAIGEAAVAKFGVEHVMLDPWNKQDHSAKNKMGGDEGYLVHSLGLCTKWSMETRQSLILTAHPKRLTENMQFGTTRPVPDGAAISGGQTWENMPHFVGAVHRPFKHITGNYEAAFYSHKCKDELNVAKLGTVGGYGHDGARPMVPVDYDPISLRFRWGNERWSPLDNEVVTKLYSAPTAAPAPQLFKVDGQPIKPVEASSTIRTAAPAGAGFEAEARPEATAPTEPYADYTGKGRIITLP